MAELISPEQARLNDKALGITPKRRRETDANSTARRAAQTAGVSTTTNNSGGTELVNPTEQSPVSPTETSAQPGFVDRLKRRLFSKPQGSQGEVK